MVMESAAAQLTFKKLADLEEQLRALAVEIGYPLDVQKPGKA